MKNNKIISAPGGKHRAREGSHLSRCRFVSGLGGLEGLMLGDCLPCSTRHPDYYTRGVKHLQIPDIPSYTWFHYTTDIALGLHVSGRQILWDDGKMRMIFAAYWNPYMHGWMPMLLSIMHRYICMHAIHSCAEHKHRGTTMYMISAVACVQDGY